MKQYKIPVFLFLLFSVFQCPAQTEIEDHKEDRIDIEYKACVAKDSSSANICNCAFVAYDDWNKEMESAYKKLMRTLKKDKDKDALKNAQAAWVAFKDAEFKSYDYMFNRPGGNYCGMRQDGRIDIVRTRTLQLRNYIESLKKNAK